MILVSKWRATKRHQLVLKSEGSKSYCHTHQLLQRFLNSITTCCTMNTFSFFCPCLELPQLFLPFLLLSFSLPSFSVHTLTHLVYSPCHESASTPLLSPVFFCFFIPIAPLCTLFFINFPFKSVSPFYVPVSPSPPTSLCPRCCCCRLLFFLVVILLNSAP